jgi:hypothetical protein
LYLNRDLKVHLKINKERFSGKKAMFQRERIALVNALRWESIGLKVIEESLLSWHMGC